MNTAAVAEKGWGEMPLEKALAIVGEGAPEAIPGEFALKVETSGYVFYFDA